MVRVATSFLISEGSALAISLLISRTVTTEVQIAEY